MTLSTLSETCETCDGRAKFTGRVSEIDGRLYAVVHCDSCRVDFPVWSREKETFLRRYVHARKTLEDPAEFDGLWRDLQGDDPDEAFRRLAKDLRFNADTVWPALDYDDTPLGASVPLALIWAELWLDHAGLRPVPDPADRLEQALVAAMRSRHASCALTILDRLERFDAAALEVALLRAAKTRGADVSFRPLLPLVLQIRSRGDAYSQAVSNALKVWPAPYSAPDHSGLSMRAAISWLEILDSPLEERKLIFESGHENAPDSPDGHCRLELKPDGRISLTNRRAGHAREWQAQCEKGLICELDFLLRAAGVPPKISDPFQPGASLASLTIAAAGQNIRAVIDSHVAGRNPGWQAVLQFLRRIQNQTSGGEIDGGSLEPLDGIRAQS